MLKKEYLVKFVDVVLFFYHHWASFIVFIYGLQAMGVLFQFQEWNIIVQNVVPFSWWLCQAKEEHAKNYLESDGRDCILYQ